VALGTILLPSLSKAQADGDAQEYSDLLDWGLRLTFLLALPAAVGMATLAEPMISTLFHYGKFTDEAAVQSTRPLIAYSIGLLGIILVKILAPAFYAQQNIRTPVRIALGVLIATQLMNWLFVPYIQVAGLALSIGLGACINAAFLYAGLRKRGIHRPRPGWVMFCAKLIIACGLMGAASWYGAQRIDWLGMQHQTLLRLGALLLLIGVCAAVYFGALLAMGFRLRDFKRTAR
jgi:putative peptidoglycan lipid II flippase